MRTAVFATVFGLLTTIGAFADWDNNPSFEDPYTTAWVSYEPSFTTNSSDFAFDGVLSLAISSVDVAEDPVPGGNLPSYTVVDSPFNAATPGTEYIASVYYYLDAPLKDHERLGLGLFWLKLDGAGTALEYSSIDVGSWSVVYGPETAGGFPTGEETVGAWTKITITGIAPADAEFASVGLELIGDGATVYFDAVDVIPEPASILLLGMGLVVVGFARRRHGNR